MEDDEEGRRWLKNYLSEHEITWEQIPSGAGWESEVAQLYDIHAIPLNLLFDREGKVIAVDIRGKKLDESIASLLNGRSP